jgi:hypothetical protein
VEKRASAIQSIFLPTCLPDCRTPIQISPENPSSLHFMVSSNKKISCPLFVAKSHNLIDTMSRGLRVSDLPLLKEVRHERSMADCRPVRSSARWACPRGGG